MAAHLGEFEQLVLLAILRFGPKATCAGIRDGTRLAVAGREE